MSRYTPDELQDLPNHGGEPRAQGDRFFALPDDDDVGELLSASTSWNRALGWPRTFANTVLPVAAGLAVLGIPRTDTRTDSRPFRCGRSRRPWRSRRR